MHNSNCSYSKFFRRVITVICTCKGDFRNSYFLSTSFGVLSLPLIFFRVMQISGPATFKRKYLKHKKKTKSFFQNTTCSCPFFEIVCNNFIWREELRSTIHSFKRTGFSWTISISHPFFSCKVNLFNGTVATILSFKGYMKQIIFDSSYLIRT